MNRKRLTDFRGAAKELFGIAYATRPGNLYGCEYKGVAGKPIRKVMKTKGEQNGVERGDDEPKPQKTRRTRGNMAQGIADLRITEGLFTERRNSGLNGT